MTTFLLTAAFANVHFWGGSVAVICLCGVSSFEVFSCCVVSFSRTSVILPSVLLMLLPFSLFVRAWILSFIDWLIFSVVALLTRVSRRSRALFILFCVVSGFCVLKTSSLNDLKFGWWLCRCTVWKRWWPPGVSSCHDHLFPAPNLSVGLLWFLSPSDIASACILGGICMARCCM